MPDLEFPWAGETPRARPRYNVSLAELLAAYAACQARNPISDQPSDL